MQTEETGREGGDIARLEARVAELAAEVAELRAALTDLSGDGEGGGDSPPADGLFVGDAASGDMNDDLGAMVLPVADSRTSPEDGEGRKPEKSLANDGDGVFGLYGFGGGASSNALTCAATVQRRVQGTEEYEDEPAVGLGWASPLSDGESLKLLARRETDHGIELCYVDVRTPSLNTLEVVTGVALSDGSLRQRVAKLNLPFYIAPGEWIEIAPAQPCASDDPRSVAAAENAAAKDFKKSHGWTDPDEPPPESGGEEG